MNCKGLNRPQAIISAVIPSDINAKTSQFIVCKCATVFYYFAHVNKVVSFYIYQN